jgi:hypothetical protein
MDLNSIYPMFWGRNKKTRKGKLVVFLIIHIAPNVITDLPSLSKQPEENMI